ncbi:unnamed protein product [Miscanthus lutarioriparius]|uniref:TFIIS N-terminal domain-containing protein n=1 Tax=Miscanthus lutarioriparius TaxID=422564 RepID=A0A811NBN8_9POAL|nr:unnamed protein product [Miscanthus lutarioriparius]
MLCDAEDEDERAEQLCLALDGAMAESLVTLLEVPVSSRALASGDLAKSVSTLGQHESSRIRSLTRDVVRGWRSAVDSELDSAKAAMEALNNLSRLMPPEKERLAFVVNTNVHVATAKTRRESKTHPTNFHPRGLPSPPAKTRRKPKTRRLNFHPRGLPSPPAKTRRKSKTRRPNFHPRGLPSLAAVVVNPTRCWLLSVSSERATRRPRMPRASARSASSRTPRC